jgi:hypothetical protein
MGPDEYTLDVLYRLQQRFRRRVEEGDPAAPSILTAIERLVEDHERRAADTPRHQPGMKRGRIPPA